MESEKSSDISNEYIKTSIVTRNHSPSKLIEVQKELSTLMNSNNENKTF
jgi:hypothetical protein